MININVKLNRSNNIFYIKIYGYYYISKILQFENVNLSLMHRTSFGKSYALSKYSEILFFR